MAESLSFEETLAVLQGWLGRHIFIFVGRSPGEPGAVAYSGGTLARAAPDEGYDASRAEAGQSAGETLHFSVVDERGDERLVFVLHETFFREGLWSIPGRLFTITQGDPTEPRAAINLRLED